MPKFTFIAEDDDTTNTLSFTTDYWPKVVDNLIPFLRGTGFHLGENAIQVEAGRVNHDMYYVTEASAEDTQIELDFGDE